MNFQECSPVCDDEIVALSDAVIDIDIVCCPTNTFGISLNNEQSLQCATGSTRSRSKSQSNKTER